MKTKLRYESRKMVLNQEFGMLKIRLNIVESFKGSCKLNCNPVLDMYHTQN